MSVASERRVLRLQAREKQRELVPRLRAAIRQVRAERKARLKRCAGSCTGRKARVVKAAKQLRAQLIARIARVKEQARAACGVCRVSAKAGDLDKLEGLLAELATAHGEIKSLRRRAGAKSSHGAAGGKRAAELRSESDDEVRRDIGDDPLLLAAWEAWRGKIHGSAHQSRTEAFLQYVHDHSGDLAAVQAKLERRYDDEAEAMLSGLRGRHGRTDADLDAWRHELAHGERLLTSMQPGRQVTPTTRKAPEPAPAHRDLPEPDWRPHSERVKPSGHARTLPGLGDVIEVLSGDWKGRRGRVVDAVRDRFGQPSDLGIIEDLRAGIDHDPDWWIMARNAKILEAWSGALDRTGELIWKPL